MAMPPLNLSTSSSAQASGSAAGGMFGDFGLTLSKPAPAAGWLQYALPGLAVAGVVYLILRGR